VRTRTQYKRCVISTCEWFPCSSTAYSYLSYKNNAREPSTLSTPGTAFRLSRKKLEGFLICLRIEASLRLSRLSCETDVTRKVASNYRWTQQSQPEFGCYWNSSQIRGCHVVAAFPQRASNAESRHQVLQDIVYIHGTNFPCFQPIIISPLLYSVLSLFAQYRLWPFNSYTVYFCDSKPSY
jgi:hypothetical protein